MALRTNQGDGDRFVAGETHFGALAAAGMLVFFLVFMLLEQAGMPDGVGYFLTGALLVAAFAISGLQARTTEIEEWQTSRRRAAPAVLGMSLAATMITGASFTALPGSFFAGNPGAAAWVVGPLAGVAICALLIAPYLRKSAVGPASAYFLVRHGSRTAAAAAMLLILAACLLMLTAQLQIVGGLSAAYFAMPPVWGITVAAGAIALAVIPGGQRGLIRTNALAYVLLAAALLTPLAWISIIAAKNPLPQLAFGAGAGAETADLESQLARLRMRPIGEMLSDSLPGAQGYLPLAGLTLFLILAFMAFPPLLAHFSASRQVKSTRPATGWSIALAALVLTAAPAVAAFAKLAIYDGIFGMTTSDIRQAFAWILEFSSHTAPLAPLQPLVMFCGEQISDASGAVAACGGNPDYALSPADLAMEGEVIALAFPEMLQIPSVFTMAIGAGAIAAAMATANASAFALSSVRVIAGQASGLVQIFVARLAIVAGIVAAAVAANRFPGTSMDLALWSLAICAGILAPAFLMSVWWSRMTALGATAGMVLAAAAMAAFAAANLLGPDLSAVTGDERRYLIEALRSLPLPVHAAAIALPVFVTVAALAALLVRGKPDLVLLEQLRAPDMPSPPGRPETS